MNPLPGMPKSRLIIIGAVLLVIIFLVFAFLKPKNAPSDPNLPAAASLTAWGLREDTDAFNALVQAYQATPETKNYKIEFRGFASAEELERTLINSLAENRGPDIFYFHNTWLLKHGAKTQPAYNTLVTPAATAKLFPQTVSDDLMANSESGALIYALPLHMDALGVVYNKDIMEANGVTFGAGIWENLSWTDFIHAAQTTKLLNDFTVIRAGAALGTARNIPDYTDILSALLLQGDAITRDADGNLKFGDAAKNAFLFYLQFANRASDNFTWNNSFPSSRDEFARGNVAMIVDYHSSLAGIRQKNQFLDAQIVPLPQLSQTASKKRTYASYWGLAVSNFSRSKYAAWHFVRFAALNETANKAFLDASGKLPALTSLINKQAAAGGSESAFLKSFFFARSWRQQDPEMTRTAFGALVENVQENRLTIDQAMRSAQDTINQ
jgi:ABC-type glycerol-3-phosphate transport system substrate-binding protein